MSVWSTPDRAGESLFGAEGPLTCICIEVDPRRLESLLEALAQLPFPINPQIYHSAAVIYRFADGRETAAERELVEFPAYACRLSDVKAVLDANGFNRSDAHVKEMLEDIQRAGAFEPAPAGAPYVSRRLVKTRRSAA